MRALRCRLRTECLPPRRNAKRASRLQRSALLPIAFCLLTAASARGIPLDEIPIGTSRLNVESAEFLGGGEEVTYLVIDFRAAGGGSFAFGYRHDGMATALDMLESFATAGVLEIAYEDFSFGPAIRGVGYPREEQEDVFPGAFDGPRSWVLWEGAHADGDADWSPSNVGINGVEFGNTEPTVFLPAGGFYGLSTWAVDDYPGPPPLVPLPGDFDSDGIVDGHDLLDALLGFGTSAGPTLAAGDADRDGNVDRADIALWWENVGAGLPVPSAGGIAIGEPSSLVLIVLGLFGAHLAMRGKVPGAGPTKYARDIALSRFPCRGRLWLTDFLAEQRQLPLERLDHLFPLR